LITPFSYAMPPPPYAFIDSFLCFRPAAAAILMPPIFRHYCFSHEALMPIFFAAFIIAFLYFRLLIFRYYAAIIFFRC